MNLHTAELLASN